MSMTSPHTESSLNMGSCTTTFGKCATASARALVTSRVGGNATVFHFSFTGSFRATRRQYTAT